jgi:hypothetical protein
VDVETDQSNDSERVLEAGSSRRLILARTSGAFVELIAARRVQCAPDPGTASVQQDALVGLAQRQKFADLHTRESLDVAQRDNLALSAGQLLYLTQDVNDPLACLQAVIHGIGPVLGRAGLAAFRTKPVSVCTEIAAPCRGDTLFACCHGSGPVRADLEQPRAQGRTAFEPPHASEYREPRLLGYVFGTLVAGHKGPCKLGESTVVPLHQYDERFLVAGA